MGAPIVEVVKLGKHGELTLSRRLRSRLGWHEGDDLVLSIEDKRVVLERRGRGRFGAYLDVLTGGSGPTRAE
jgi:bifunctional DNA-binding transcriptional regulator/antitoxin component of YhaV-PrlF toxin-antitoxin module